MGKINLGGLKIFYVEFGVPEAPGSYTWHSDTQKPLHVMAKDYTEAANSAMGYAMAKRHQNITDEDGSLNNNNNEIKIKSVRCICDEVVW